MDEDFPTRSRKKDNSMIYLLIGGAILLYLFKSGTLGPSCGVTASGTNTCLPAGPTILPDTGGYSVQGGGIPPTGYGDNPFDYWMTLSSYGKVLG